MSPADRWADANRAILLAHLARVRSFFAAGETGPEALAALEQAIASAADGLPAPSSLDVLVANMSLSVFERDVMLLCAGVELDSAFAAALRSPERTSQPTFALAMSMLPQPHWSAMSSTAPLRRYRILEAAPNEPIVHAPLRIDERVLHFLVGMDCVDERVAPYVEEVPTSESSADAASAYQESVDLVLARWQRPPVQGPPPVTVLCGEDETARRLVAAAVSSRLNMRVFAMRAGDVPNSPVERESLLRSWEREALLELRILLIEIDDGDGPEPRRIALALAERAPGLVAISCHDAVSVPRRVVARVELGRAAPAEQRNILMRALGSVLPRNGAVDRALDRAVGQFSLGAAGIEAASAEVRTRIAAGAADSEIEATLWEACRTQARPRIEALAQRIDAVATWDDLVIPAEQQRTLEEIVSNVRQRARVYDAWGFAKKGSRGLGISALFAGVSGTGKTMAAEVVAGELHLDLFRVDLSQVVSKYIGETEKNLRRIFDAAEGGGAILLFDEADALFGKRSEVKDSHDRYANVEISYLLQRMETYRGLAVLTSNMRGGIDTAFLRRVRFIVEFPFPDAHHRAEIWRRVFPTSTPTAELDFTRLARLPVAGGNIRNIALQGAFLAADAGQPVRMEHLARAARTEFAKLERPVGDADIGVRP